MFNKKIRENNRKLRQRVCELEETCKNIEELIDYKNECIEELKRKLSESEYREKIWENDRKKSFIINDKKMLVECAITRYYLIF